MNAGDEVGKEMARAGESLSSAGVLLEKALLTDAPSIAVPDAVTAAPEGVEGDTHHALKRFFPARLRSGSEGWPNATNATLSPIVPHHDLPGFVQTENRIDNLSEI